MSCLEPVVCIASGNDEIRERVHGILRSAGMCVTPLAAAADYLRVFKPDAAACFVIDMDLPDMSGLEFQRTLAVTDTPVVFVSRHMEIWKSVQAMKAGAIDYLPIRVDPGALVRAVQAGIELDRRTRSQRLLRTQLEQLFSSLTPREREAAALIVRGMRNKNVAAELGISMVTVQIHRGNVMRKIKARSLPDLVRMTDVLGVGAHSIA